MNAPIEQIINIALQKRLGDNWRARFVKSDEECSDDEICIEFAGVPSRVSVQAGYNYLIVNEYLFRDGRLFGIRHHGEFERHQISAAINTLIDVLCDFAPVTGTRTND